MAAGRVATVGRVPAGVAPRVGALILTTVGAAAFTVDGRVPVIASKAREGRVAVRVAVATAGGETRLTLPLVAPDGRP